MNPIAPRLRLRRLFLWAAVVSLAVGGVVAVAALLLNQFTEQTGRILGTLGAMAFHCGAAIAMLHKLDKGRAVWVQRVGLGLMALSFLGLLVTIWGMHNEIGQAIGSTALITGAYLLAGPGGALLDRRTARPLAWAALALPAAALVLALAATWESWDKMLWQAAGTAGIAAFTAAQFALLVVLRAEQALRWLYLGTIASALIVGAGVSWLIWVPEGFEIEAVVRVLGAVAVVDACSTFVLLVLARLRKTPVHAAVVSHVTEVWLRCPRCAQEQDLALGGAACAACGLKIEGKVEATHCAECGYTLHNLPARVCPECGTAF